LHFQEYLFKRHSGVVIYK